VFAWFLMATCCNQFTAVNCTLCFVALPFRNTTRSTRRRSGRRRPSKCGSLGPRLPSCSGDAGTVRSHDNHTAASNSISTSNANPSMPLTPLNQLLENFITQMPHRSSHV
jgi:hypothetical protein